MRCPCGKVTNFGNLCVSCSQSAGIDSEDTISYEDMLEVIDEDDGDVEEWLRKEFDTLLEES